MQQQQSPFAASPSYMGRHVLQPYPHHVPCHTSVHITLCTPRPWRMLACNQARPRQDTTAHPPQAAVAPQHTTPALLQQRGTLASHAGIPHPTVSRRRSTTYTTVEPPALSPVSAPPRLTSTASIAHLRISAPSGDRAPQLRPEQRPHPATPPGLPQQPSPLASDGWAAADLHRLGGPRTAHRSRDVEARGKDDIALDEPGGLFELVKERRVAHDARRGAHVLAGVLEAGDCAHDVALHDAVGQVVAHPHKRLPERPAVRHLQAHARRSRRTASPWQRVAGYAWHVVGELHAGGSARAPGRRPGELVQITTALI